MADKKKKITRARITLKGSLSLAVGRYRFEKDRPVVTDDAKLIAYVQYDPAFRVQDLSDEKTEKKAPAKKPSEPAASKPAESKPAEPEKPKPEPVTGDEEDGDPEEESAPALTRKSKEGGAE